MTTTNSRYTGLTLTELEAEEAALQVALEAVRGKRPDPALAERTQVLMWLRDAGALRESWAEQAKSEGFARFNLDMANAYRFAASAIQDGAHLPLPPAPLAGEAR